MYYNNVLTVGKSSESRDVISDLVGLRQGGYDPANPDHAAIISDALIKLGCCTDTVTLLLEATGKRPKDQHNQTYDDLASGDR